MRNINLKKAEELAKYLPQKDILQGIDVYEQLVHFRQVVFGKFDKRLYYKLMLYHMALSMQELKWSDEWKTRDVSVEPLPDYAN